MYSKSAAAVVRLWLMNCCYLTCSGGGHSTHMAGGLCKSDEEGSRHLSLNVSALSGRSGVDGAC